MVYRHLYNNHSGRDRQQFSKLSFLLRSKLDVFFRWIMWPMGLLFFKGFCTCSKWNLKSYKISDWRLNLQGEKYLSKDLKPYCKQSSYEILVWDGIWIYLRPHCCQKIKTEWMTGHLDNLVFIFTYCVACSLVCLFIQIEA